MVLAKELMNLGISAIFFTLRLAVLAAKSLRKLLQGKDAFHQAHGWNR